MATKIYIKQVKRGEKWPVDVVEQENVPGPEWTYVTREQWDKYRRDNWREMPKPKEETPSAPEQKTIIKHVYEVVKEGTATPPTPQNAPALSINSDADAPWLALLKLLSVKVSVSAAVSAAVFFFLRKHGY